MAYSFTPGYADWIRAYTWGNCVGYALTHLTRGYMHAVVVLEADDHGVLLADSVRGLIHEPWAPFLDRGEGMLPTRIESWYALPPAAGGSQP